MEEMKKLTTPLTSADVETLKVGDKVSLTGVIYTGRDSSLPYCVTARSCQYPMSCSPS